jgi:hypothetical protein
MRRLSLLLALLILCSGARGVEAPREPNEPVIFTHSHQQGSAAAQTALSVLYESGRGGLAKNDR